MAKPIVAIVGRPNVGKSSLFNAILGRRMAIVHEMSGVTRDRVSTTVRRDGRCFTLIDTGGLGLLAGETKNVEMWDAGIAVQVEAAVADALTHIEHPGQLIHRMSQIGGEQFRSCRCWINTMSPIGCCALILRRKHCSTDTALQEDRTT